MRPPRSHFSSCSSMQRVQRHVFDKCGSHVGVESKISKVLFSQKLKAHRASLERAFGRLTLSKNPMRFVKHVSRHGLKAS